MTTRPKYVQLTDALFQTHQGQFPWQHMRFLSGCDALARHVADMAHKPVVRFIAPATADTKTAVTRMLHRVGATAEMAHQTLTIDECVVAFLLITIRYPPQQQKNATKFLILLWLRLKRGTRRQKKY